MHLAFLTNEFPPEPHGGIGSFISQMARTLDDHGHRVDIVGFGTGPSRVEGNAITVHRLTRPKGLAATGIRARIQLHRHLLTMHTEDPFDVIETPDFEGLLPMPFEDCCTVVRLHHAQSLLRPSLRAQIGPFEEHTLHHHRRWIAVSDHILDRTTHHFDMHPTASEIIPPPVQLETITEADRLAGPLPRKFVLFSGPLTAEKGVDRLIECAPEWLRVDPDLFLIHTGPVRRESTQAVEAACGADAHRIAWLGWMPRSRFHYLLTQACALITLSTKEAFGMTAAEACLAGCPVLCPQVPPFSDFYDDELVWYDPTDLGDTADLLDQILSDPESARDRACRGGRKVATECAPEHIAERSLAFYERFLRPGRSS